MMNTQKSENLNNGFGPYGPMSGKDLGEEINLAIERLDEELTKIQEGLGYSNSKMVDLLTPALPDSSALSKIKSKCQGSRHVTLALVIAMRKVFGLDINGMIDSGNPTSTLIPKALRLEIEKWLKF